jgi:hypothetical protein
MMDQKPPDVIVLGAEWPERALLRAQLIEEGHEVVAVDTWPIPRLYRRPGMNPRVLLIDLHELPEPRETLDEVRIVLPPDRVLVVTAGSSLRLERSFPEHPRNRVLTSHRHRAASRFMRGGARGVASGPPESSDQQPRPQASEHGAGMPAQTRRRPRAPWR